MANEVKGNEYLSASEASAIYKLIYDRSPTNATELAPLTRAKSSSEVWDLLLKAQPVQRLLERLQPGHKPLGGAPMSVQINVGQDLLGAMIARTEKIFTKHGENEPHWTVLTDDKYKSQNIQNSEEAFFKSGKGPVEIFCRFAQRSNIDLKQLDTCLELGCGVGRSTVWLAELFPKVIAADISQPLLSEAQKTFKKFNRNNIETHLVSKLDAYNRLPKFDVFFSLIVLQHNPPPIIHFLLDQILEKCELGGLAYFQVPTYRAAYKFDGSEYLKSEIKNNIEMHVLPQADLFDLLRKKGFRILEIREDGACGPTIQMVSNTIFAQKG